MQQGDEAIIATRDQFQYDAWVRVGVDSTAQGFKGRDYEGCMIP